MAKNQWEMYFDAVKIQNWDKALACLNDILKKEPNNPQVHLKVGDTLQKAGDVTGAVKAYHQSAWLLMKEGFFQKSLAIYKIILRLDPYNDEATNKSKDLLLELESSKMKASFPSFEEPKVEEKAEEVVSEFGFQPEAIIENAEEKAESGEVSKRGFEDSSKEQVEFEPSGFEAGFEPSEGAVFEEAPKGQEPEPPGFEEASEEKADIGPSGDGEFEEIPAGESEFNLSAGFGVEEETEEKVESEKMWKGFGEESESGKEQEQSSLAQVQFDETGQETEPAPAQASDDFFQGSSMDEGFPGPEPVQAVPPVPLFLASMPDEEREKLVGSLKPITFPPGHPIVQEGESGDSVFLIKAGTVKVNVHILGKEIELATLSTGDVFGEVAFLTGRPRTASVIAVDEVEAVEFDRPVLEDVFERYPDTLKRLEDFYQFHLQDTLGKVKTNIKK